MIRLRLQNGVSLEKDDDGVWVVLTTNDGSQVSFHLDPAGEISGAVLKKWTAENMWGSHG